MPPELDLLALALAGDWPQLHAQLVTLSLPLRGAALAKPDALGRCVLHVAAARAPRATASALFDSLAAASPRVASLPTTASGESVLHWLLDSERCLAVGDAALVERALAAGADAAARSSATGPSPIDLVRARLAAHGRSDAAEAAACLALLEGAAAHGGGGAAAADAALAAPRMLAPAPMSGGAAGAAPRKKLVVKLSNK